ncbi:dihydrofolate reductase [Klebsiella phage CPRSB]|nr:dihydrofolate reductase [Klebsiella phage CPRSB]
MSIVKAVFALGIDIYHDDFAFGYQQGLPWGHCKEDLQNFKEETADSVLIMGANTFTSLPGKLPVGSIVFCLVQVVF